MEIYYRDLLISIMIGLVFLILLFIKNFNDCSHLYNLTSNVVDCAYSKSLFIGGY